MRPIDKSGLSAAFLARFVAGSSEKPATGGPILIFCRERTDSTCGPESPTYRRDVARFDQSTWTVTPIGQPLWLGRAK